MLVCSRSRTALHRCELSVVCGNYLQTADSYGSRTYCSINVGQKNRGRDWCGELIHAGVAVLQAHQMGNDRGQHSSLRWLGEVAAVIQSSPRRGSSAATTAAAPCSLIQPAKVSTSAGSRFRIHRSLYRCSQQSGVNPRPWGECHDNRFQACSHHVVPEFVSPGEVCHTTVQKLHWCWWRRTVLTASVSVAFLALQTCFRSLIASTYQLAHGQSMKEATREVYCLKVRPAEWPIDHYLVWALYHCRSVPQRTSRWPHPADHFVILSPLHITKRTGNECHINMSILQV